MWQTYFFRWQNQIHQSSDPPFYVVYFQSSADDMKEFNVTGEVMICENRYWSLWECIWPKHKKFCGQVDFEGLLALPNDSVEPCKLWLAGRWLHCLWWWHLQCSNDPPKVWFNNLYKVIVYRLIVYSQLFIVRRLKFIGASTMWTRQALWLFVSTASLAPWTQTASTGWANLIL